MSVFVLIAFAYLFVVIGCLWLYRQEENVSALILMLLLLCLLGCYFDFL